MKLFFTCQIDLFYLNWFVSYDFVAVRSECRLYIVQSAKFRKVYSNDRFKGMDFDYLNSNNLIQKWEHMISKIRSIWFVDAIKYF